MFNLFISRGSWNTSNKTTLNYQLGYEINIESTYGKRIEGGSQEQTDLALFGSFEWNPFSEFITFRIFDIKAVRVHHLGPGAGEVLDKPLPTLVKRVELHH